MPGFSCDVEVVLAPAEQSGLTEPVRAGNRSLLYVFGGGDPGDAHSVTYGAAVTDVASGGAAGETLAGRLWFWAQEPSRMPTVAPSSRSGTGEGW